MVAACAGSIDWEVRKLLLKDGHAVIGIDNITDVYDIHLQK